MIRNIQKNTQYKNITKITLWWNKSAYLTPICHYLSIEIMFSLSKIVLEWLSNHDAIE